MGDTLLGKELSGTPMETRGATSNAANMINQYLQSGGRTNPFGRARSEAVTNMLGFDPSMLGLEGVVRSTLSDPRDATSGLFSALKPFEQDTREQTSAQLKETFGSKFGARFSPSLLKANRRAQGDLTDRFARTRAQALLQADQNRIGALGQLLGAMGGANRGASADLGQMLQFISPGTPNFQPGILGDLLSSGATAAALAAGG